METWTRDIVVLRRRRGALTSRHPLVVAKTHLDGTLDLARPKPGTLRAGEIVLRGVSRTAVRRVLQFLA